jgi:hypothetical protein
VSCRKPNTEGRKASGQTGAAGNRFGGGGGIFTLPAAVLISLISFSARNAVFAAAGDFEFSRR